jgi:hypothetical protein
MACNSGLLEMIAEARLIWPPSGFDWGIGGLPAETGGGVVVELARDFTLLKSPDNLLDDWGTPDAPWGMANAASATLAGTL